MTRWFLPLLTTAAVACGAEPGATEITQQQLLEATRQSPAPLILDVRTPDEFAAGHVPGAVNVPHDQVAQRVDELADHRGREVIVYCERGGRAAKANEALAEAGFAKLRHLTGDMAAWREAGLPEER